MTRRDARFAGTVNATTSFETEAAESVIDRGLRGFIGIALSPIATG